MVLLCVVMQVFNVLPLQMMNMVHKKLSFQANVLMNCTVTGSFSLMVNILVILVVIPLMNQCVYPFLRNYTPNMLKRIGIGCILIISSVFGFLLITAIGQGILSERQQLDIATQTCMFNTNDNQTDFIALPLNSFITLLPQLLLGLSEVFVYITSKG